MTDLWTIVPVKDTRHSKQRLTACLTGEQRRALALVMLEDVLEAIAAATGLERCLVVTIDPDATALSGRLGARVLTDGASEGHTGAVMTAARLLAREGAAGFLTLPGDIPGVTPAEIAQLLAAHRGPPAFTIAPAHDELGSNAVLCSPPGAVPLRFGENSFFPHLDAARRSGIEPTVLHLPGIALDIDTPEDLARFMALELQARPRTFRFMEGLSVPSTTGQDERA
jgi:2-phospho-L-lactate/phosphoenolpyruvate guanylyltransferase